MSHTYSILEVSESCYEVDLHGVAIAVRTPNPCRPDEPRI